MERVVYSLQNIGSDETARTREKAMAKELSDWSEGNMLFGEGLYYHQRYDRQKKTKSVVTQTGIGFGHLGYVNYFSQLGIIGFLVYALWFQFVMLRCAKKVFMSCKDLPWTTHAAAFTGTILIFQGLICFMSSSVYLSHSAVVPSILTGTVWAVSLSQRTQKQAYV
jgi:hypothetical protein